MASTRETRQARLIHQVAEYASAELMPLDIADAVANLRPSLERVRRGQWRLIVMGPTSASERDEARMFSVHLASLADTLRARS